jgi:hypothetical protein
MSGVFNSYVKASSTSKKREIIFLEIHGVSKRITRIKITISNNENVLQLQNKLQTINPLNAELNSICHLLVLLGNLTFTGPCIVNIFQYISIKMQLYTVYLYLETALHVSGGTSTNHRERIQLYLQHLVFVTPLLLSAAIVEELE